MGVSFGEEGGKHKEHTQMGVFLVFEGMGRVREATNTKNTPRWVYFSCSKGWAG